MAGNCKSRSQIRQRNYLRSGAVWGASFLFMRIAALLGPVLLIELRVLIAGFTLLLIAVCFGLIGEIRTNFIPLLVIGCINSAK